MIKLKDLRTSLQEEVNLWHIHPIVELWVDDIWDISTDEFPEWIEQKISIQRNKTIKVKKVGLDHAFDALQESSSIDSKIDIWDKSDQKNEEQIIENRTFQTNEESHNIVSSIQNKWLYTILREKYYVLSSEFSSIIAYIRKNPKHYLIGKIWVILLSLLVIIWTDKLLIEYFTTKGYSQLQLIKNWESKNIWSSLSKATWSFNIAETLFLPFRIIPGKSTRNAHAMIIGWKKLSHSISQWYDFWKQTYDFSLAKWVDNVMYSQLLDNKRQFFIDREKELEEIEDIYIWVDLQNSHPEIQIKLKILKNGLKKARSHLFALNNNFETFLNILWHTERVRYLIAFQNNDEIRPQGWFMWSIWLLDLFRWQKVAYEKNDVYFYEFKIKKEQFTKQFAPKWIHMLTQYLGLRDSNYYINHKDAAKNIRFFMKKAWYPIDGILYINQNTFLEVMDIIGPFYSEVLKREVTSQDFSLVMSLLVEAKVSQNATLETPKQILFDFTKEFEEKLKSNKKNYPSIANVIIKHILNREIAFYHLSGKERKLLEDISVFHPIDYYKTIDFSYPVFTSLSWNKSDRYTEISYTKSVSKNADCSFDNTLDIFVNHTFWDAEENQYMNLYNQYNLDKNKYNELLQIQWKWTNKQYVRVILPKDIIVKNKDVWITDYYQRGKSLDFYMNTPVWQSSQFTLEYRINNPECKKYNYSFFKQPWIKKYNLKVSTLQKTYDFNNHSQDVFISE